MNKTKILENGKDYTISGTLANNFICKNVNGRIMYQSKLFLNKNKLKNEIIDMLTEYDDEIEINTKFSNSIMLNIWNVEVYEQHKLFLEKGSTIEINGILKYKVYNRFCGGKKVQLFFSINNLYKITESNYGLNKLSINNNSPNIVYYQF